MDKAVIHTTTVILAPSSDAVEVTARLVSGTVLAGMFLHIPLNGAFDVTAPIADVTTTADGGILLLLDCDNDPDLAAMVLDFNFADETLHVKEGDEI